MYDITILSGCAPVEGGSKVSVDVFWAALDKAVAEVPAKSAPLSCLDANGHVGRVAAVGQKLGDVHESLAVAASDGNVNELWTTLSGIVVDAGADFFVESRSSPPHRFEEMQTLLAARAASRELVDRRGVAQRFGRNREQCGRRDAHGSVA